MILRILPQQSYLLMNEVFCLFTYYMHLRITVAYNKASER